MIQDWLSRNSEWLGIGSSVIDIITAVLIVFMAVVTWMTRREQKKLRQAGEHWDNFKFQTHTCVPAGDFIQVGITTLGLPMKLGEIVVDDDLPPAIVRAAMRHRGSHIFRMPTERQQDHLYRDSVSVAGALLPHDAEDHVLVILCENTSDVKRKMLRGILVSLHDLGIYQAACRSSLETEQGKRYQQTRLDAIMEIANATRGHDFNTSPVLRDGDFVVAHRVRPSTRSISRA